MMHGQKNIMLQYISLGCLLVSETTNESMLQHTICMFHKYVASLGLTQVPNIKDI